TYRVDRCHFLGGPHRRVTHYQYRQHTAATGTRPRTVLVEGKPLRALSAFAEDVRSTRPSARPQPPDHHPGQAGDTAAPAPRPAPPTPPAEPELDALEIHADETTLLIGGELPLSVTGKLSNGSTQPFTDPVVWSTKPANVVRIDGKG